MNSLDQSGPDLESITTYTLETYPGTDVVEAMHAWFFSLDPEKHFPNFATIVTTDEHDPASNLSRPGVFRLNIGVDRATFNRIAKQAGEPDYTALDRLLPHPATPGSSGSASSIRPRRRSRQSSNRFSSWLTVDSPPSGRVMRDDAKWPGAEPFGS